MNDDEQTARLKKQKYLNSEIIQKGYDAVKFKEFLETKKPGGIFPIFLAPRSIIIRWGKH